MPRSPTHSFIRSFNDPSAPPLTVTTLWIFVTPNRIVDFHIPQHCVLSSLDDGEDSAASSRARSRSDVTKGEEERVGKKKKSWMVLCSLITCRKDIIHYEGGSTAEAAAADSGPQCVGWWWVVVDIKA